MSEEKEHIDQDLSKLELRSEEVQEILTYIPPWIIRWGITLFFVILMMVLILSWFIKYPEVITARITITSNDPTTRFVARTSGRLQQLFIEDGQLVEKGEVLGVIENPARASDVIELERQLNKLTDDTQSDKPADEVSYIKEDVEFKPSINLALGELQQPYMTFQKSYNDYKLFTEVNYYPLKMESLKDQIDSYTKLRNSLVGQKAILQSELDLFKIRYDKDKALYSQGVVSQVELNTSKSNYLQKKYILENTNISVLNHEVQVAEYRKALLDLDRQFRQEKAQLILSLESNHKQLIGQLKLWKQNYLFQSPINGYVSFFKYWSQNQFVSAGDEVMAVVPSKSFDTATIEVKGIVYLQGAGAGKVEEGQKVRVKLDDYPHHEYGQITGFISSISLIPRENQYLVNISFPKRLKTSYKKELPFRQDMQGNAEVITKDLRLLERVFNQLRSLLDSI